MEADLGNMVDLEVQLAGSSLGVIVLDKEWSLSAVRIEIYSVFKDKAPEEFEFWIHGEGEEPKKVSHRREAHIEVTSLLPPTVLEIRALDD